MGPAGDRRWFVTLAADGTEGGVGLPALELLANKSLHVTTLGLVRCTLRLCHSQATIEGDDHNEVCRQISSAIFTLLYGLSLSPHFTPLIRARTGRTFSL